ncbi:MAG: 3-oxoacyl-[acyl-carrier-protein] reductase [Lutisporaceae bacterium]
MSFTNKTVLVTGASRGLGRAIAEEFAMNNANVIINYNNSEETALELKECLSTNKGKIYTCQANVSNFDEVKRLFKYIKEEVGSLDILVNNAGITRDKFLVFMNEKDWHDVISTNLDSVYYCSKESLRFLASKKAGTIINIASIGGIMGNAGQTNYSASKAGIIAFTKSLSKEVAKSGITVNAIAPGFIETDMTLSVDEKTINNWKNSIPLKRFGNAKEVAKLALFLASDNARYITGQTVVIDGGLSC